MQNNFLTNVQDKLAAIEAWWNGENTVALIAIDSINSLKMECLSKFNDFWPNSNKEPDFEGLANAWKEAIPGNPSGAALPASRFLYGKRGASMTISYYLGGNVTLGDNTVWVKHVAESLDSLKIEFDSENLWLKRGLMLMEKNCSVLKDHCLVAMPDFGDALTCLSLLIGTENLLLSLMDDPGGVKKAIQKFSNLWPKYHRLFWDIYCKYYPGDHSPLIWAPGKTYTVQCDFSTMISPQQFKDFVVPELEAQNEYLEYMVWHLDGPDEIKHLDILLDLPFIKAIQWVPGAGQPTARAWIDMLEKIQSKKKSVYCYSYNEGETDFLIDNLCPQGLFVHGCY